MKRFTLVGVGHASSYELRSGLNRIGRNPTNDFRVSEASVSSFHCEVLLVEEEVRVRDLCSTNGTALDGKPVTGECGAKPGQILQLGAAEFRLEERVVTGEPVVRIPKLTKVSKLPQSAFLDDGCPACRKHQDMKAVVRCTNCESTFCEDCARILRTGPGSLMIFCPDCSARCGLLPDQEIAPSVGTESRPGLVKRLTQTIRIGFYHLRK